ncbi:YiaA/YiaB family inner membrane protein [Acaryochloris marina NIES-2412]|uniref:YiaA/YiaB family inner membrane protein n=1 Tax=Acaryochloris marina TaxID=155978 RepID=UPI004059F717
MTDKKYTTPTAHTSAWIAQTWISFTVSIAATGIGIIYMPVNTWMKGYLGMGTLFSIGSTISLSKTIRDVEESKRVISRLDEAKVEKMLAEYDPYNKVV